MATVAGKLTKEVVEAAEPGRSDRFLWDSKLSGFGLKVSAAGGRIYVLQYREKKGGKSRRYTIGCHGDPWTAAKARQKAELLLLKVRTGEDPVEDERKVKNAFAVAAAAEALAEVRDRFETVLDTFIEHYAKPKNKRWRDTKRVIEHDAVRVWRGRAIASISRRDVIELIDEVRIRSHSSARALFAQLRRMFAWAVERLYIDQSPFPGLRAPTPSAPRDRWLSDEEVVRLWASLEALGGHLEPLFKVLLLTAQRREEVGGMRWSELDLERGEWIIPKGRSKNRAAHAVDLAPEVLSIIRAQPRRGSLVFTTNGETAPSGHAKYRDRLLAKMRALRAAQAEHSGEVTYPMTLDWTVHDLRRTAATGMARLGYTPHVIEAVLNHRSGSRGGLVAVYQHYDQRDARRTALAAWAAYVSQTVTACRTPPIAD